MSRAAALAIVAALAAGEAAGAPTDMVLVPAGRFTMGSRDGPADERPM